MGASYLLDLDIHSCFPSPVPEKIEGDFVFAILWHVTRHCTQLDPKIRPTASEVSKNRNKRTMATKNTTKKEKKKKTNTKYKPKYGGFCFCDFG